MSGIILGIAVLLVIEFSWREHGARPEYVDGKPRWSWVRSHVSEQQGVVLLGASRMHFGFSLAAFRDRYPDTPIYQLAVAGAWPYAALRDLAEDESFHGIVLISFTPDIVMSFRRRDQQPYVYHYRHRWNADIELNFFASSLAEHNLVTRHQNYGVDSIMRRILGSGRLPEAALYLETMFDREMNADYSHEDISAHRERRINEAKQLYDQLYPISVDEWRADLTGFLKMAHRIHNRGGCVIAVRFPSQGELLDYEERLFPRNQFWVQLEPIPYLGTVHAGDMHIMTEIKLPDLQHVDAVDKRRFTDELMTEVEKEIATVGGGNCVLKAP